MKKLLTATAGLLLVLGAAGAQAQAQDPAVDRADWMIERLQFNEEQQAEVSAILAEAREQREALMAESKEERKALQEQLNAIRKTTQERIAGVLTEEQSAQLTQMRERMQKRAVTRMRPGMRGPEMQRFVLGQGWRRATQQQRDIVQQQRDIVRRVRQQRQEKEEAAAAEE